MDFYTNARNKIDIALKLFLEQISGKAIFVTFGAGPYSEREVVFLWQSGQQLAGWQAETDTRTGLASMLRSQVRQAA